MAQVYFAKDDDPGIQAAIERARKTFRYFWREISWEHRRIIPGLEMACVKVPFVDPGDNSGGAEQMWVSDVDFDGSQITGTLLNSPHWLKSVHEGDSVETPVSGISDWMYVINDRVYGAYTVNAMRCDMSASERRDHDAAWGLNFGDPNDIHVVPADWYGKTPGLLSRLFGGSAPAVTESQLQSEEHPMAVNMADSLREFLAKDPENVHAPDDNGLTMLHHHVMAGSVVATQIALECGADVNATTSGGLTPLQLAESLGWREVTKVLRDHGAS